LSVSSSEGTAVSATRLYNWRKGEETTPKVVITMPAYRAEATLERTVADIPPGIADRLILVDDASPDNTADLARGLGIDVHVHVENLGYGGNQKTCYVEALSSGADIVVLLHPDYQYEPKAVPLLIAPIIAGDADMTFGSRFAGLGDPIGGGMPLYRFVGNRMTTVLENVMLGSRFSELHSGLRAYTRRCLLSLPILSYSDDFVFDSQLLIDAVTLGQRVVEVPIPTRYTKESSSIAVGRSLAYILGTLGYCASRVASRGRRGRRSIVARSERMHVGEGDAPLQVSLDTGGQRDAGLPPRHQLLHAVARFLAPGSRLLVFAANEEDLVALALDQGWQATLAGDTREPYGAAEGPDTVAPRRVRGERQAADAAIVVTPVCENTDDLQRARARLNLEGILAARAAGAELAHAALTSAGFRMVEWIPHEGRGWTSARARLRSQGPGIAVARPR
jgi:Glycosyl transferase family 2